MTKKKITLIVFALVLAMAVAVLIPSKVFSPIFTQLSEDTEPQSQPQSVFDKAKYSLVDPSSTWVIVSKVSPLNPVQYQPSNLSDVGNGVFIRNDAAKALKRMISDAQKQGLSIQPLSGYRSYQQQQDIYNNEVNAFGQVVADSQSARPGHSEHQTGLAVDVGGGGCGIEDCFGDTVEGKWVAANAHDYGFIVRYVVGKDSVTGYKAEPWHLRFTGTELSKEMYNQNITTLEEFFGVVPDQQPW